MYTFPLESTSSQDLDFVPFEDGRLQGLVCHRACHDLLVQRLKYLLKLRDVRPLAKRKWEARLMESDYGGILAYQTQVVICLMDLIQEIMEKIPLMDLIQEIMEIPQKTILRILMHLFTLVFIVQRKIIPRNLVIIIIVEFYL